MLWIKCPSAAKATARYIRIRYFAGTKKHYTGRAGIRDAYKLKSPGGRFLYNARNEQQAIQWGQEAKTWMLAKSLSEAYAWDV